MKRDGEIKLDHKILSAKSWFRSQDAKHFTVKWKKKTFSGGSYP